MDLLATLRRSGGIDALGRQVGLPPVAASAGAEALLPALLAGLRDYVEHAGGGDTGIVALLAVIDGFGDGDLAAQVLGPGPLAGDLGDRMVAQLLETPGAGHRIADAAHGASGLETAALERILPLLAMLVCGYISARAGADSSMKDTMTWLRELLVLPGRAKGA